MGSPSDLSLHYRPQEYPPAPAKKLEEFLARLEDERHKIEAFQRELPLSMHLLNHAVEVYRRQLHLYHGTAPVLEEFIPLKNGGVAPDSPETRPETVDDAFPDRAGWMSSTQLWCPADGGPAAIQAQPPPEDAVVARPPFNTAAAAAKAVPDANRQRPGGAFVPFSVQAGSGRGYAAVPELALATAEEVETKLPGTAALTESEGCAKGPLDQGKAAADGGQQATVPSNRKARRCWTPDLHRRFVNALQMLGGSQVATPKQIRELMRVDGLTNDEVKSHLQKYRLHTRRPIPAPPSAAPAAATAQLLVLGGIWVPPEYATAAAAAGPVIYSGHPAAHFCPAQTVQQDYYSTAAALQSPHHRQQQPPPPQHHGMPAPIGTAAPARAFQKVKDESPEAEERGGQLVETTSESIGEGEEKAADEGDDEVEEDEEEGRRSESSSWEGGDEQAEKLATGEAAEDVDLIKS